MAHMWNGNNCFLEHATSFNLIGPDAPWMQCIPRYPKFQLVKPAHMWHLIGVSKYTQRRFNYLHLFALYG